MRLPKLKIGISGGSFLRVTFLAGLMLLIFTGGILTVFWFLDRSHSRTTRQQDSFFRILRDYDISAGIFAGTEKEFEKLNGELDRLEKRAISVESWLSILKRRRALANQYLPSVDSYHKSIKRALNAHPLSQPIAAVAAAAFVKDTAVNRQTEEHLRDLLPMFTDSAFNTLSLGLHVLLGDFKSPEKAAQLPAYIFSDGSEDITMDLAITKVMRSDFRGAAADIQSLLNSSPTAENSILFAAEYYYDFGDLRRSAELFSQLESDQAMLRQADALYLSGYTGSARSLWSILAENLSENSLYNLAVTSEDPDEAAAFLEKLTKLEPAADTASRQFGLIRYSRLLEYPQAISVLEGEEKLKPSNYPFIDLEICRRHNPLRESGRQLAETWLLLDRHPEDEELYRWAAWTICFQRYFDELKILLRRADQFQFGGNWVPVYRAIQLMQEGDIETAESLLRMVCEDGEWHIYANLARVLEAQRSASSAIEQYGLAAEKAPNPKTASRIQLRLARCYSALGRTAEAFSALQYALGLDPDNLSVQLELDRMIMP